MIHIVISDIEWNNTFSGSKSITPTLEKTTDNRKRRNQDLMRYENKYKKNKKSIKTDEKSQVKIEEINDESEKSEKNIIFMKKTVLKNQMMIKRNHRKNFKII